MCGLFDHQNTTTRRDTPLCFKQLRKKKNHAEFVLLKEKKNTVERVPAASIAHLTFLMSELRAQRVYERRLTNTRCNVVVSVSSINIVSTNYKE